MYNLQNHVIARARIASASVLLIGLSACATLPSSGPTKGRIEHAARASNNPLGFKIIPVDPPLIDRLASLPPIEDASRLLALMGTKAVDTLGQGDILNIDIFEVGASLFNRNGQPLAGDTGIVGQVPTADGQPLSGIVVDRDGAITLPYAGRIVVAGLTTTEVQHQIEQRLKGLSQHPQAIVTVRQNLTNTVYVMGNVQKPGRLGLTLARETILDAIALAGGAGTQPQDMTVRFTRDRRTVEVHLQDIRAGSPEDLILLPGDRIEIVHQPRSFTVFGATGKVAQISFDTPSVSLAEAVVRAGGPSDATADARAVFIFRYEPSAADTAVGPLQAGVGKPVIYRLNLYEPVSYFLAQRFAMRDKDVIYVANAASVQPGKLVQIISQLFTPVILAHNIVQ